MRFLCHINLFLPYKYKIVAESDILGPNGNLSDIKNLVSFEREMPKDARYSYRIKQYLLFMSLSPL